MQEATSSLHSYTVKAILLPSFIHVLVLTTISGYVGSINQATKVIKTTGQSYPSRSPVLDHRFLKTLVQQDSAQVVHTLSDRMPWLKYLLRSQEDDHTSHEFMLDLICVLAKTYHAPATQNKNKILAALKGSVMLNSKIPTLLDQLQGEKSLIDRETGSKLIEGLIEIFFDYLRHLPRSYTDLPREQLQRALDQMDVERKDQLQKQLDEFKRLRDEVIRTERLGRGTRFKERREKPPNDFREIPVCPTNKEVVSYERPFLRKNITKGNYEDTEHYLDVQFRLLREDFLEPLREGIYEITHNVPRNKCNQMMKRYNGLRILRKEYTMSGITFKVKFDVSRLGATRWKQSRRLIFGSFLCLSRDNFQTMLFATVANRDPDELKYGELDIQFIEEQDILGIERREDEYVMVESPAYFEAYRHVLKGLKELDEDSLPFKKYLVECSADVDPPNYLTLTDDQRPVYYDLSKALHNTTATLKAVNILQPDAWPSAKDLCLNNSQLEALKTAITTEFSVIQGPPGTGKTYVGAKIVKCLLDNRVHWKADHASPMLMVCYTNHALDQFLEKVLDFVPRQSIIRVGGRCKSLNLEGCNLKRFIGRYRMNERRREIQDNISQTEKQIRQSNKHLQELNKNILGFNDLEDIISLNHAEQFARANFPANADNECRNVTNTFKLWLCNNTCLSECNKRPTGKREMEERSFADGSIVPEKDMCDDRNEDDVFVDAANNPAWLDVNENESQFDVKSSKKLNINHRATSTEAIAMEFVDENSVSRPTGSDETQSERGICGVERTDLKAPYTGSCLHDVSFIRSSFSLEEDTTIVGNRQSLGVQHCSSPVSLPDQRDVSLPGPSAKQHENKTLTLNVELGSDTPPNMLGIIESNRQREQKKLVKLDGQIIPEKKKRDLTEFSSQIPDRCENQSRSEMPVSETRDDKGVISFQQHNAHSSRSDLVRNEDAGPEGVVTHDVPVDPDGETIAIEEEADYITCQRLMEGEEDCFQPLRLKQVDDEKDEKKNQKMLGEHKNTKWTPVTYSELSIPLFWQEEASNSFNNDRKEITPVGTEGNNEVLNQQTSGSDSGEGWNTVSYSKKSIPYFWQQEASNTFQDDTKGFPPVSIEESNDTPAQETTGWHSDEGWSTVSYSKKSTPYIWQQEASKPLKTENEGILQDDIEKGSLVLEQLMKEEMMTPNEVTEVDNVWFLTPAHRQRLYLYWLECYRGRLKMEIQREEQNYVQLCSDLQMVRIEEEEQVLRRATVVGMTTSCAARYHTMLQRIAPKIVVIEEAAEVMEAHIITSLSRDTEHTILIGDHKQLRPKATVYELAQKYNLEISLFERMVVNKMDCKRLSIQHRMRPEIAELTKRIYDHEILDHESVCHFDDIMGVGHNLFFIHHCQPEKLMGGLQSYCNTHEADFLVALCEYLLLQGYKQEQITILTMYAGQLLELQGKMPRERFEGVKVCVVDNFQGEENDIILLSLVRSNGEGRIGFLRDSNRICVALSRARRGFYCIGNFHLLTSQCKLWKEIRDDVEIKKAFGKTFQLVCQRHKNVNEVRTKSDFGRFPNGGCGKPCQDRLACGHACDKPCHPTDLSHKRYICRKRCLQRCPNEHQCQKMCHYPEDCRCQYIMTKTIPQCGHKQNVPCSIDAAGFPCREKCEKILDCGHNCKMSCGATCTKRCQVKYERELPCGHKKMLACYKSPTADFCNDSCNKVLECGHPCSMKCHQLCRCTVSVKVELSCKHQITVLCPEKDHPLKCSFKCDRQLECGHRCPGFCFEECSSIRCKVSVEKILPCGHLCNAPCYLNPEDIICSAPCKRQLVCGHQCPGVCSDPCHQTSCQVMVKVTLKCKHALEVRCGDNVLCPEKCDKKCARGHPCLKQCHFDSPCGLCNIMVNKTLPVCNHCVPVPCYKEVESVVCSMPCERLKSCKHPCKGRCGQDCTNLPCKIPVPKKLKCGHTEVLHCHQNPDEYSCKTHLDVQLPCGHTKSISCSTLTQGVRDGLMLSSMKTDSLGESSDIIEVTPLPWKDRKCSEAERKVFCDAPCNKRLSCGHRCPGRCNDDCSGFKCAVKVQKVLPCRGKHYLEMHCYEDPSTFTCKEPCRKSLDCGHPCPGLCREDCRANRCNRKIGKAFPCGHRGKVYCFEAKTAICKARCNRQRHPCKHVCHGFCGEPCSKHPCMVTVVRALPCGHRIKVPCSYPQNNVQCPALCKVKLQCGHECYGCCGYCQQRGSHEPCRQPCHRLLVCSHRCEAKCGEPCPPCFKPCRRLCPHRKCKKRCSEPCKPCQQPCAWTCPHYQCNNLCWEICDRPPCDARCSNRLSCGHQCIGLCGENCPTICGVCHAKQLLFMSVDQRGNRDQSARFLQLFDCGHLKTVAEMDKWMQQDLGSDVQYWRCPDCPTPITFSYRYGHRVKRTLQNLENVKTQAKELAREAASSSIELRSNIPYNRKRNVPWLSQSFLSRCTTEVRHYFSQIDVLLLFTLKNHFQILCEIHKAQDALTIMTKGKRLLPEEIQISQKCREIEELSSITGRALEQMEQFLQQPHLHLGTLCQLYEHTRKFFLFCHVLEAEVVSIKHQTPFSPVGEGRLRLAQERFKAFRQGDNGILEIGWLETIVNSLRKELQLHPLPAMVEKDFENFPGFCRGVWKLCRQGHVFVRRLIVRLYEDQPVVVEECHRCGMMEPMKE